MRFSCAGLRAEEISQGPWQTRAHPDDVVLRQGFSESASNASKSPMWEVQAVDDFQRLLFDNVDLSERSCNDLTPVGASPRRVVRVNGLVWVDAFIA